jgi:hypothetical protein
MKAILASACIFLAGTGAIALAEQPTRVDPNEDGHSAITIDLPGVEAKFDYANVRWLERTASADGTMIAANFSLATKSAEVHIWLRSARGDLLFLNDVNERVARLLRGRLAEAAAEVLRVKAIRGRKIYLVAVHYPTKQGDSIKEYDFVIRASSKGELSLARDVPAGQRPSP